LQQHKQDNLYLSAFLWPQFFSYTCIQIVYLKTTQLPVWSALTWSIMTTVLLCLPGSVFPKENWFDKIWLDKWVHIGLFSMMTFLWCWVTTHIAGKKIRFFVQIAFYFFLYGVAMEFVQKYFIPNRSFDFKDMIADTIGIMIGLLVSMKVL
jgi:VanZ family protein